MCQVRQGHAQTIVPAAIWPNEQNRPTTTVGIEVVAGNPLIAVGRNKVLGSTTAEGTPSVSRITRTLMYPMHLCQDVVLWADARSTPPRVAAVLFCDNKFYWMDTEPPAKVLAQFEVRGDRQIASLEILALAYGFSSFTEQASRSVHPHRCHAILLLYSIDSRSTAGGVL